MTVRNILLTAILSVGISVVTVCAEEASLQQLIRNVKQSKGDARRKAMNALKLKLRSMNEASRKTVLRQLRQTFASHGQIRHDTPNRPLYRHVSPASSHPSPSHPLPSVRPTSRPRPSVPIHMPHGKGAR